MPPTHPFQTFHIIFMHRHMQSIRQIYNTHSPVESVKLKLVCEKNLCFDKLQIFVLKDCIFISEVEELPQ